MTSTDLQRLFRPRSIAVVGASPKGGYGLTTLSNVRAGGFQGELYVVHPTLEEVDGIVAYPSLTSLPMPPDAVAVAVPAKAVPGVLADAVEMGAGGAVVYGSGFGETGEAGHHLQEEMVRICGGRLPVVGPNCLGVASYRGHAALWGITLPFVHVDGDGSLAIAAQSGNMSLTTMFSGRLPAVAYGVSLGNQALVGVSDVLEFFLTDNQVRVVALIIEGLTDLPRFRRLALQALEQNVRIVALKVGRSARGERATLAHTGTLAGSDGLYDALFRQTGVIRVDDLDELIAVSSLLSSPVRPRGRRLGIFASSGGECGLVADLADTHGIALPELSDETRNVLQTVLPDYGYLSNPFDLTAGGWGQLDVYETTARALARDPEVDIVAFVGDAPSNSGDPAEAGWPEMVEGAGRAGDEGKPVALITTTTDTQPELARLCRAHGVILLPGLSPALRALALAGAPSESDSSQEVTAGADVVPSDPGGEDVSETRAKGLLHDYGIAVPPGGDAADADAAVALAERIGYPVVAKVDVVGLGHKSDIGGVAIGLQDATALREAAARLLGLAAEHGGDCAVRGLRVERHADTNSGMELIVGGQNLPGGSMVVVGAGGVLTELVHDAVTLLWPFTTADVLTGLRGLRTYPLLTGYRGSTPVDLAAVATAVVATGRLLADHPEIVELDVNPLLCTPEGAVALDALVRIDHRATDMAVAMPLDPDTERASEEGSSHGLHDS
jgi:acyl-CoA synthetase (NDP forming)